MVLNVILSRLVSNFGPNGRFDINLKARPTVSINIFQSNIDNFSSLNFMLYYTVIINFYCAFRLYSILGSKDHGFYIYQNIPECSSCLKSYRLEIKKLNKLPPPRVLKDFGNLRCLYNHIKLFTVMLVYKIRS